MPVAMASLWGALVMLLLLVARAQNVRLFYLHTVSLEGPVAEAITVTLIEGEGRRAWI